MNYLYDLPLELQDKILGYTQRIELIETSIRTNKFTIENIFVQNTNKKFSMMIQLYIEDNMIFADCDAFINDWWGNTCKNIFHIPMMSYPSNKYGLKKLAKITKKIYVEYLKNIYENAKRNFQIVTKSYFEISFPNWEKSINDNIICDTEDIVKKLKTKDIYKALCVTWFPNINFFETKATFDEYEYEDRRYYHYLSCGYPSSFMVNEFMIEDTLCDMHSETMLEPFSYRDLTYIQECFPTIYSLLEEHDKLYSINRKLPIDLVELFRMKKEYENAKENKSDFMDKYEFNSKVDSILTKYDIQNIYKDYATGYLNIPSIATIVNFHLGKYNNEKFLKQKEDNEKKLKQIVKFLDKY
jgi:hypothetical protein